LSTNIALSQTVFYQTLHTGATFDTRAVDTNKPVGSTPGAADVASGAASYTIPIAVPQGTNGVVPSLSVSYNSMGGNGILGMGWGLTGLSAISRGTKSHYFDGKISTLDLTNNDVFYLDGSRLVPISGNNGDNNTVYKTESESFSTITSYGSGYYAYFKVITKDGVEMEFGNTYDARWAASKITTNDVVLIWRINRIKYPDGNYIDFVYTGGNGVNGTFESTIDEIKYTGNTNTGLLPYNSVKFTYLQRTDKEIKYEVGAAVKSSYLLDKITVKADGTTAKSYQFNYASDISTTVAVNSYLKEVIELGSNGTALNSTIFKYGDQPAEVTTSSNGIIVGASSDMSPADFDGDGYSDILTTTYTETTNPYNKYNTGFKVYKRTASDPTFNLTSTIILPASYAIVSKQKVYDGNNFMARDFNGDGADDIVAINSTITGSERLLNNVKIYQSDNNGVGFTPYDLIMPTSGYKKVHPTTGNTIYPGDYNGDGIQDLICTLGFPGTSNYSAQVYYGKSNPAVFGTMASEAGQNVDITTWAGADKITVVDFDGNGKSDLMVIRNNICEIFSFNDYGIYRIYTNSSFINKSFTMLFGDFNGDRKTDILYQTTAYAATWNIAISNGINFTNFPITFQKSPSYSGLATDEHLNIADYNGDGKSDIYHAFNVYVANPDIPVSERTTSRTDIYYSIGENTTSNQFNFYTAPRLSFSSSLGSTTAVPADIDGDGRTDNISYSNYASSLYVVQIKKGGKENLLHKVKTGTGLVTEWNYKRLTEAGAFYTRGAVSAHPLNNIQIPMNCVSDLLANNGIGGTSTTSYSYEEAKLHKLGRGLIGFKTVTTSNATTGYKSVSENEFNTSFYISLPKKSSTYLIAGNKLMSETIVTNVLDDLNPNNYIGKRYFVRNTNTTTNSYFEGDFYKKTFTTTDNTYDSFGNITGAVTNNNNVENISVYANYGAFPGSINNKPTGTTTYKTRAGQTQKSNSTSFGYNSIGQLTSKIDFVGLTNTITTTYGYNSYGNNNYTKITPNGLQYRETSSVFDPKGRAAESNTNVLGQISYTSYNWTWGKPNRTTSINGILTDYEYDAFGRASYTSYKVGQGDQYQISQAYTWDISGNQIYKTKITHPGKPDVTTWSDILGREIKTETEGFGGASIFTAQTYDAKGNVATSTKPNKTGEAQLITTNNYDGYGRMQSINSNVAVFGSSSVAYSWANGELTTTTTTPDGQTTSKVIDATGKVIRATDVGGTIIYTYNSQGNLLKVNNGTADVTVSDYDDYGRQTYLTDKNAGTTSYTYDAIGQLLTETNAKGNVTTMVYDISGRVLTRSGAEGTTTNNYNSSGSGINQLNTVTSFAGNTESYAYNGYGQLSSTTEVIDGKTLTTNYLYNKYDDVTQKTYQSGLKIGYNYDANGYISQINNVTAATYTLYANNGMNGFGQNTNYSLGNGKVSTNTYFYGVPTRFQTAGVQDLEMTWQYNSGNLTQRKDYLKNKWEDFLYDTQNRLTSATVNGASAVTIAYESLGNITSKTDAGNYSYDGSKINAVASVTNPNSTIPLLQQDIVYNSFQQPTSIAENSNTLVYTYGSDYNRIKGILNKGGVTTTRYYFGDYEETTTNGVTKQLAYISSPAGLIAIVEGTGIYHFTYTDHLGSIVAVTNSGGTIEYEQNFDAWGRRRDPANWSPYAPTATVPGLPDWLYRGYTGHEMLDAFGLINMNARLYDPVVGRMLGPDNYVQDPFSSQSFNKFTYAGNNPTKYIDPDGNFFFIPILIGAAIGGVVNLGFQAFNGKIKNGGDALKAFGIGAVAGGAAVFAPQLIATIGGTALTTATGYVASGAIPGAVSGAVSGAITGAGNAIFFNNGKNVGRDALGGLLGGGIFGGAIGGVSAWIGGKNFWTGAPKSSLGGAFNLNNARDLLNEGWSRTETGRWAKAYGDYTQFAGIDAGNGWVNSNTKQFGDIVYDFSIQNNSDVLYNFGKTAASHMNNPGRYVPVSILDDVIQNTPGYLDPKGSSAMMHYSQIYKGGNPYNLEVLFDKASNSIWHFEYKREAMGPLLKISKIKN
jgi:RHS repeat-associated protein